MSLRRRAAASAGVLIALALPAGGQQPNRDTELLSATRIAALPPGERGAWEAYLERSRMLRERDLAALAAEARAAGLPRPAPATVHSGFFVEDLGERLTADWLASEAAAALAEAIVSFQTPAGGWSKRLSFERPRRPGESWVSEGNQGWLGTLDNGGTTEQLHFLARIAAVRAVPRWRDSFVAGIEYLLAAQYPNGCFPQVYPLVGSYHDAATFNDDVAVHAIGVLRAVAAGEPSFVTPVLRERAGAAAARGIGCILKAQVSIDGRPAVWGQQHDPLTLAPVRARAYEHASLASKESAQIALLLMALDSPAPAVRRAVRGAIAWFRENALYGYDYEAKAGRTARAGAGPLWARFAELGTNRPIFSNRDGVVLYDFERLDDERRTGYGWYSEEPAAALRQYRAWSAAAGRGATAAPAAGGGSRVDAVVDVRFRGLDGSAERGVPTFRSIAAALAAAPPEDGSEYMVEVRPGRYREKLHIERARVRLVGAGRDSSVLTFDAVAGGMSPGGWPWGTRGTATLRVAAPDFRLSGMTVENAFDYLANAARPAGDSAKLAAAQAVAVMLDEGSDRAVFEDCRVTGHQDTLFPNAGRSWFHRCTVSGSVDFIFGAGTALFEQSEIVSRDRGSRSNNGYITAPSTPVAQAYGLVFRDSRLLKESPAMAPASVTLGRPWHPAGDPRAVGQAVFIDCWLDDHVSPAGWTSMYSTDAAGQRTLHEPAGARFFEHASVGPGSHRAPTRPTLLPDQLGRFDPAAVLGGWNPRS